MPEPYADTSGVHAIPVKNGWPEHPREIGSMGKSRGRLVHPAPQLKKKFIPTVTRKFAEVASSGTSTLAYI
jgi:hypothetical protein